MGKTKIVLYLSLAACTAGACAFALLRPGTARMSDGGTSAATNRVPARVEVRLANRTLMATGFPERFCRHQTASSRGTAPYVVALTNGASKVEAILAVRACGARVIGPLPPNALLVETSIFALGKMSVDGHFAAASEWLPEDKLDPRLKPVLAQKGEALDVTVVALASADVDPLVAHALSKNGERVKGCPNGKSSVTLKLPRALVAELAKRGDVRWIEPFVRPKLLNDLAVEPAAMNVRPVWDARGLTGAGQLVTTSDSGIDTGDLATMHADLRNRVVGFGISEDGRGRSCNAYDADGHGTHTAGSIVGDGTLSGGAIRGTACGAQLWAWFCGGQDDYVYPPSSYAELFRPDGATNACVHSASWGNEDSGAYAEMSRDMDEYVWEHPDFLPVIANGNAGSAAGTVGSPATAKNVLSVGATQNIRTGHDGGYGNGDPTKVVSFSSRGPCADGRIKPDLCAPGSGIVSTRVSALDDSEYGYGVYSNSAYAYMSGTSMATPLAAGAAALVRQWLVERRGFTNAPPTAALVKAVLTGGAKDVTVPDNDFGWGRVDVGESLYPSNRAVRLVDRIPFGAGSEQVYPVTLTNGAPFDVQLVWIDYPGTAGSSKALVNDLDLIVSNRTTGAVWFGNGTPDGDRTNNVESVRLSEAPAGTYAVIVRGYDVSYDSAAGGAAALYLRGAFEETGEPDWMSVAAAVPASPSVTLSAGETQRFEVTVTASPAMEISYAWSVDGAAVPDAATNVLAFTASTRGTHPVKVVATGATGVSCSHAWSVYVRGDIRVDAARGDDATATGGTNAPYATVSAALAAAEAGDVLRVAPGTYAGGLVAPSALVRIESTDGPDVTILDGGGTNRCYDGSANASTVLAGFTLTNGWIDASYSSEYGAGAYCGTLTNCVIVRCRITDDGSCRGYGYGGGAAHATLVDCRVENCSATDAGGGLYGCTATFCVLAGNEAAYYSSSYGGGASESTLTHCTVFGNVAAASGGGVDCECVCTDSIVWGNTLDSGEEDNWELHVEYDHWGRPRYSQASRFSYSCTTPEGYSDQGGNTNAAPRWTDAANGDFRLAVKSPCLGTASDGTNMGAWQGDAAEGFFLTTAVTGPGSVDPASAFVEPGKSATFRMSAHHRLVALATNGVSVDATSEYVWPDVREDGVLTATFAKTNFYVEAATGDDAASGWSQAEAKRTIQAAVDVAGDGETVWVGPGVYTGAVEATRATVEIVGTGGPDRTKIVGSETNRCYEGFYNPESRLVGFTLENGNSTNNYGGAVFNGTLSNCVIRACRAAWGGGGAYEATLYGCTIADCEAGWQGGGAYASTLVNCTVRGCRARNLRYSDYNTAGGGVDYTCSCVNTILWGNSGPSDTEDNWELYVYRRRDPRHGLVTVTNAAPSFSWCCTVPYNALGANGITDDPLFATTNAADPTVYEISPCLGAGQNGVNIGAYLGPGAPKVLPPIDPETATGADVSNAVASVGYADEAVVTGIGTNAATYVAFQAWSTNGLASKDVLYSTRAFDSFLVRDLVAAPTLLGEGNETTVELTALAPASDGTCSTVLRLVDGETDVPLCSVKAAFAARTRVGIGPDGLAPASAENVATESVDGGRAVKLTITPPAVAERYFLRFIIR